MSEDKAMLEDGAPSAAGETPPARRLEDLPPAARRALMEAEERRKAAEAAEAVTPKEYGGRKEGLEPVRYGDWEKKGIAVDF